MGDGTSSEDGSAASEDGSERCQGIFFSLNIFIIKKSMLLTFLRLLRIVNSGDWEHRKRDYRIYPPFSYIVNYAHFA